MTDELKTARMCRFCLSKDSKLFSIFSNDRYNKSLTTLVNAAPLAVQVIACASIEKMHSKEEMQCWLHNEKLSEAACFSICSMGAKKVFVGDGLPSWICEHCRCLFDYCYSFKQMCKEAETQLRQYPLTGRWPQPLNKPKLPPFFINAAQLASKRLVSRQNEPHPQPGKAANPSQPSLLLPAGQKKLLNADPAESPEPPVPKRLKKEKMEEETTIFLDKFENDEELSIEDVHRLLTAVDEDEFVEAPEDEPKKPKLLNKASVRILNKEAQIDLEPRLSVPQVTTDEQGNVATVIEILDPDQPYEEEPDPVTSGKAIQVETNIFPCDFCDRSFPLKQLRDMHMRNHDRVRNFECDECCRAFFSKYDLAKHYLIHTGARPFQCTVCDRSFTRATLLRRHEKTHTDIPKVLCVHCEKAFISKEEMEKHAERHTKMRPFECKVCNKRFAFKQGLERHETVHDREQPYHCEYCGQSFSTQSKLARHLTAHAGKRPYPCKFCAKSYLLSHHLTRHLRSHKVVKQSHKCQVCRKVFALREELIVHSHEHALETLSCPLCNLKFSNNMEASDHIKLHAGGDSAACEFCDLIFVTNTELDRHAKECHIEDMRAYDEQYDEELAPSDSESTHKKDDAADDGELQETIDEFLVEELDSYGEEDKPQILSQVVLPKKVIKVEKDKKEKNIASKTQSSPQKTQTRLIKTQTPDTSFHSVLKSLPKGVSIRRTTPAAGARIPEKSPHPPQQPRASRSCNEAKPMPKSSPPVPKKMQRSPQIAQSVPAKPSSIGKKMSGVASPAVKVQKVSAGQGRIIVKDGKVMLTKIVRQPVK